MLASISVGSSSFRSLNSTISGCRNKALSSMLTFASTAIILSMTVKDNERQPLSKSKKSYVVLNKIEDSNTGRTDLDNRKIIAKFDDILILNKLKYVKNEGMPIYNCPEKKHQLNNC